MPHAFKNSAEFHFFYLTLVPQISHLREENQKNAFADELLEDYFKAKGKKEYSLTIEAIKFSGRKLICSVNLPSSHSRLAFFPTPETNKENKQDNEPRFLRLNGG